MDLFRKQKKGVFCNVSTKQRQENNLRLLISVRLGDLRTSRCVFVFYFWDHEIITSFLRTKYHYFQNSVVYFDTTAYRKSIVQDSAKMNSILTSPYESSSAVIRP